MRADLDDAWEVLGEAIQTVLRAAGVPDGYERLKEFTRGAAIDRAAVHAFIDTLPLPAGGQGASASRSHRPTTSASPPPRAGALGGKTRICGLSLEGPREPCGVSRSYDNATQSANCTSLLTYCARRAEPNRDPFAH